MVGSYGGRQGPSAKTRLKHKTGKGVTMKAVAKTVEPAEREARFDHVRPHYLEALTLVERLHRRLLDVIKDEFDRRGRADIHAGAAPLQYRRQGAHCRRTAHARLLSWLQSLLY